MVAILLQRQRDLTVVCENIHDPHNVSAILRSCDAVGIPEVQLLYFKETFPELGKKSSASANKWVHTVAHESTDELHNYLQKKGMKIYATHHSKAAKSIHEVDWVHPAAIVMGNEHRGVSDPMLEIADESIYIPMFGMVESLNVSVATAVILYEACRQRLEKGMYPYSAEEDSWTEEMLASWLSNPE
ncbi:MAG: RNA methyltransferase [Calditrichia bacterium]